MNNILINNLKLCCLKFENIALNTADYYLITGLCATQINIQMNKPFAPTAYLFGSKIHLDNEIKIGYIKLSNDERLSWSPEFDLKCGKLEKLLEMKCFW